MRGEPPVLKLPTYGYGGSGPWVTWDWPAAHLTLSASEGDGKPEPSWIKEPGGYFWPCMERKQLLERSL